MRMEPGLRPRLRRYAADPFTRSIVLAVALIAGGFVAIGIAWRGVARSLIVAEQLPYLFSGGLGGLALIVTGAGLISVQATRYWNARERQRLDLVLWHAGKRAQPADSLRSRVSAPPK
jgi:hypothetical protein